MIRKNDTEMYSIHNEGTSVVTERVIRTLKTKIYKYMTLISNNVYIDKLNDIVNEYNNTDYRTNEVRVIFAGGKFKLFLNDWWYEPETLWLFLTFTRDYFAEKKKFKKY